MNIPESPAVHSAWMAKLHGAMPPISYMAQCHIFCTEIWFNFGAQFLGCNTGANH